MTEPLRLVGSQLAARIEKVSVTWELLLVRSQTIQPRGGVVTQMETPIGFYFSRKITDRFPKLLEPGERGCCFIRHSKAKLELQVDSLARHASARTHHPVGPGVEGHGPLRTK